MFTYIARVDRVVDGDTIDVHIDLGFDTWTTQRLRLNGIDAAETSTPLGKATKALLDRSIAGKTVTLTTYKPDKYGRYLADVWTGATEAGGRSINQQMIIAGIAKPYTGASKSNLWTPGELAQTDIAGNLS